MGVASSVALAVAERVERTAGPRAGLRAWKALAESALEGETRGKALLAALRCALTLAQVEELGRLTTLWESVSGGVWDAPIATLCVDLATAKLLPQAIALAEAEARRHRTARSLYCHARCLDVAGDVRAAAVFHDVIERAEAEGAREIELLSRVRRAAILSRSWQTMPEALEEARHVDLAQVPALARLAVARVLLASPSRFTRAGALGALDDIAQGEDTTLAARALTIAARWADDAGDALTSLEGDRLLALFGREKVVSLAPRAREAVRSLLQLTQAKDEPSLLAALEESSSVEPALAPLHARARDILRGRFEVVRDIVEGAPREPSKRRAFRLGEVLDVVVAMRDRAPARAARSLRFLAEAEEAGEHLPREVLGVAQVALGYGDHELRDLAVRLVAARLRRPTGGAPPRGFLHLADTLLALGMVELATTARRAAFVAREPGAAASLGTSLARSGWELAKAGSRLQAIAKLREAKALLDMP